MLLQQDKQAHQEIIDSDIQFVHGGSENAPTYDASISDGLLTDGPTSATITFSNVNDAPVLGNNALSVNEGQTVVLTATDLSASDSDNTASELTYTMSNIQYGQFERVATPGTAITSFTHQEITDGDIQFVHDGSENAPTYDASVSDGLLTDGPTSATITFSNINDAPVLGNNALSVNEGQTVVLTATDLSASDSDNTATELTYTMSNIQYGQFERVATPGTAITSFTHQEITDGDIQFVHDGSENAPTYDASVSDGLLTDGPTSATITFSNINDAPVLGNNALSVNEGQTVVLTATDLSASDSDNTATELTYTMSNIQYGQFERVATPGTAITSFTHQEITDGDIQFVHDGSENAPTYDASVSDGLLTDGPHVASIVFHKITPTLTPVLSSGNSISSSYLLMAAGGFACFAGEAWNWINGDKKAKSMEPEAKTPTTKATSFMDAHSKTLAKLASADTDYPNFSKAVQSEGFNDSQQSSMRPELSMR